MPQRDDNWLLHINECLHGRLCINSLQMSRAEYHSPAYVLTQLVCLAIRSHVGSKGQGELCGIEKLSIHLGYTSKLQAQPLPHPIRVPAQRRVVVSS